MGRGGRGHSHHHHHHHYSGSGGGLGGSRLPPEVPLPFYSSTTFSINYQGPIAGFTVQFARLTYEQKQSTKAMNVRLVGQKLQEANICCMIALIILGSILIFPLCILCCPCFKRRTSEIRRLEESAYSEIGRAIGECPKLTVLMVGVADSYINAQKTHALQQRVLQSSGMTFHFTNYMAPMDQEGEEYSQFPSYFPQIQRSSQINYFINWGTHIIRSQQATVATNAELAMLGDSFNQPFQQ